MQKVGLLSMYLGFSAIWTKGGFKRNPPNRRILTLLTFSLEGRINKYRKTGRLFWVPTARGGIPGALEKLAAKHGPLNPEWDVCSSLSQHARSIYELVGPPAPDPPWPSMLR